MLLNQFEFVFDAMRDHLAELGTGSDCFTYDEFEAAFTAGMIAEFEEATRVYAVEAVRATGRK
jgi:hypothetical protein